MLNIHNIELVFKGWCDLGDFYFTGIAFAMNNENPVGIGNE